MAATSYVIERIDIANVGTLGGGTQVDIAEGLESSLEGGSSAVDPGWNTSFAHEPLVTATLLDTGVLLSAALAAGRCGAYVTITNTNTCDVYLQAMVDGGTRGTCHKVRINKGMLVVDRVEGAPIGRSSVRIFADYDGTNAPLVVTTGVSALGGTPAAASLWRLAAVKDHLTVIHEIAEWSVDFGMEIERVRPANSPYAVHTVVKRFAPTARFRTFDIGAALALSGSGGALAGTNGLQFFLASFNAAGNFWAATGGLALVFRAGSVWHPESIELGDGLRSIAYAVIGKGGDTLADLPLTLATGQALDAESSSSALYRQGPVKENTTAIDLVDGTLEFAQTWQQDGPATLMWPNFISLRAAGRAARLRVRSRDQAAYQARAAVAAIATAVHVYFQRMTTDGQHVADGSAVHTKISFTAGNVRKVRTGGAHDAAAAPELEVQATGNITIATSSAIT